MNRMGRMFDAIHPVIFFIRASCGSFGIHSEAPFSTFSGDAILSVDRVVFPDGADDSLSL